MNRTLRAHPLLSALLCGVATFALLPSAEAQTAPVGWIDRIDASGVAYGWAADRDAVSQSVWVHLYIAQPNGQRRFAGATHANQPRADVAAAGYPGNHGFRFVLPSWARNGTQQRLHAFAIDLQGQGNPELGASPMTFMLGVASAAPTSPAPTSPAPAPATGTPGAGVELLKDSRMRRGVRVLKTHPNSITDYVRDSSGRVVRFQRPGVGGDPAWILAQHLDRLTLGPAQSVALPGGALRWADPEKAFTLGGPDSDFTLTLNSRYTYNNVFRDPTNPNTRKDWPHLYAAQVIQPGSHTKLSTLSSLRLRMNAKLNYADHDTGPGYNPHWHTGQYVMQMLIVDRATNDYVWYGVNMYDARGGASNYRAMEMWDGDGTDGSTGKIIRMVAYDTLAPTAMEGGAWVHFEGDLLPDLRATINRHLANGNLRGRLENFEVATLHVGWESPGLFVGGISIREISLRANR